MLRLLQMMIGNYQHRCWCVRYVSHNYHTLWIFLGLLLFVVIIIVIISIMCRIKCREKPRCTACVRTQRCNIDRPRRRSRTTTRVQDNYRQPGNNRANRWERTQFVFSFHSGLPKNRNPRNPRNPQNPQNVRNPLLKNRNPCLKI